MTGWIEWFEQPFAEDDTLLNDWVDRMLRIVSWKLYENQKNIVYMARETEKGIPKLKDGAIATMRDVINFELGWLRAYMLDRLLVSYAKSNIEFSEEAKSYIRDEFEPEDEAEFWNEVYQYIWDDYSKNIGEEETAKLWEKWGYPPLRKDENE